MDCQFSNEVLSKQVGEDTQIWKHTIVLSGATIGKHCNINSYCFIENDVIIGDCVTVKCGVYLWDGIILEDFVFIGPNVTFINDKFPRSRHDFILLRTLIKKGASIGAAATINPGLIIGEYSMIGAGSIVTKNIPNNTLWFGNPAKHMGYVCDCGFRLNEKLKCPACSTDYDLLNDRITRI